MSVVAISCAREAEPADVAALEPAAVEHVETRRRRKRRAALRAGRAATLATRTIDSRAFTVLIAAHLTFCAPLR